MSYRDVNIYTCSEEESRRRLTERGGVYIVAICMKNFKTVLRYDCCLDIGEFEAACKRVPNWFLPYRHMADWDDQYDIKPVCTMSVEYDGKSDVKVVLRDQLQKFMLIKDGYDELIRKK